MSGTSERRRSPRASIYLPVTVLLQRRPIPGDLVDVSKSGILLTCRAPIEISDSVSVRITLDPEKVACEGQGNVVRQGDDRSFGIQFEKTNMEMTELVDDLLKLRPELRKDFLGRIINPMVVVSRASA